MVSLSERLAEKSSSIAWPTRKPVTMDDWDVIIFDNKVDKVSDWGFEYSVKGVAGMFHTKRIEYVNARGIATDYEGRLYILGRPAYEIRPGWNAMKYNKVAIPSRIFAFVAARRAENEY